MSTQSTQFIAQITLFVNNTIANADLFLRDFCTLLITDMISQTPHDTYYAQASWYAGLNDAAAEGAGGKNPPMVANPRYKHPDPWGGIDYKKEIPDVPAVREENAGLTANVLHNCKMGDTVYLLNNCPYILGLEYGTSNQAPNGMVRAAINDVDYITQMALSSLTMRPQLG
jgi:hypothetical protein